MIPGPCPAGMAAYLTTRCLLLRPHQPARGPACRHLPCQRVQGCHRQDNLQSRNGGCQPSSHPASSCEVLLLAASPPQRLHKTSMACPHMVQVIVGYSTGLKPYWIVRNSWQAGYRGAAWEGGNECRSACMRYAQPSRGVLPTVGHVHANHAFPA